MSSVCLRLLIFPQAILIPACASLSLAFHIMYSAYKLNKQSENIQPCILLSLFGTSLFFNVQFQLLLPDLHTDFSGGRYGGLVFPSLEEFSTVCCDPHKGFGIVNKAEIDVFLELSCFFDDPMDVGNLMSGSSGLKI